METLNKHQKIKLMLEMLERGENRKTIAEKINIAEKTVRNWIKKYKPISDITQETAVLLLEVMQERIKANKLTNNDVSSFTKNLYMLNIILNRKHSNNYVKTIYNELQPLKQTPKT